MSIALIQTGFVGTTGNKVSAIQGGPAGSSRHSFFVSHPADIRSSIAEDAGPRLQFAEQLPESGPIVVSLAIDPARLSGTAVITITAVCPIEENLKYWSVINQQ